MGLFFLFDSFKLSLGKSPRFYHFLDGFPLRDLQHSQSINFKGTRAWRLRVISLIAFLIVVILVLVTVVAVTNQNKDAKIAEVDTNLRRQQNSLGMMDKRILIA